MIAPHDQEAETSVLGAILIADSWLTVAVDEVGLTPDDFHIPRHRKVFAAMQALQTDRQPIDTLTVADKLRGDEDFPDEDSFIANLTFGMPAIGNTKHYAEIVKRDSDLRRVLNATYEMHEAIEKRDELEVARLAGLLVSPTRTRERSYGPDDLLDVAVEHLTGERPAETFPLSLKELNEGTNGGLRRGQVMAIAGWPNFGKSSFAMDCLESAVEGTNRKARLYLTEMTVAEITHRLVARQSRLTIKEAIHGQLDGYQMKKVANLKMPNIEIQPAAGWTADQICRDILRHRPDVVLIDHFHRINFPPERGRNKVELMDEASARFNSVAKDNQANCVLLLVAHLSRPGTDKEAVAPRPTARHLRGTQMLEADADIVCMVHREQDKYTLRKLPESEIYFTRNRSGDDGVSVKANFSSSNLRFEPITNERFEF
jgi:replicative DNA helicase